MKIYLMLVFSSLLFCGCVVDDPTVTQIDTYEKCVSSGYAVLQKKTGVCETPDGRKFYSSINDQNEFTVTNYEQCVAAGYPIMETYPQKCRTPRGKEFIQETSDEFLSIEDAQCDNLCGDGKCQADVCLEAGCHCPENKINCLVDCEGLELESAQCVENTECPGHYECENGLCVRLKVL